MADVVLVLKAQNTDYINKIKEAQAATQKLHDTSVAGGKRDKGILEEIDDTLVKLNKARQKAFSYEDIEKYNKKIAETKQNLKEYENAGLQANEKIEKSGNKLLSSIGKWALGFVTITAALKIFKGVIESTDALSDKFKATLNGWKEGFGAMARAIANKDFKDFFKNVKDAVTEGQRYTNTLDKIADATRAMTLRIIEGETKILQLRESMAKTDDPKKRAELGKQVEEILIRNSKDRIKIAEAELENDMKSAAFRTKLMPEILKMYLDQNEALLQRYEIGKKLNKEAESDKNSMYKRNLGTVAQTKAYTDEEKALMALATGLDSFTDIQKDKIVSDYDAIEAAKQSAINLRVASQITINEKTKLNDFEKKSTEDKIAWDKKQRQERERLGVEEMKSLEKDYKDKQTYFDNLDKAEQEWYDIQWDREDKAKEKKLKIEEELYNAKRDLMASAEGLGAALFDRQFNNLEIQYRKQIKAAGDNEQMKIMIDTQYAKKRNELMRKAALAEKLAGLFSVGIDTAKGVANAASKVVTIPLIPWIVANGLIQAAIILSKPIPQFAKGGWTGLGKNKDSSGERVAGVVHEKEFVVRKGPAHRFREVLEAINRDDKKAIFNSFNKLSPELVGGTTINNVVVKNDGPNERLDRVNNQLKQLHNDLQPHKQNRESIVELQGMTVHRKGNTTRTIKR